MCGQSIFIRLILISSDIGDIHVLYRSSFDSYYWSRHCCQNRKQPLRSCQPLGVSPCVVTVPSSEKIKSGCLSVGSALWHSVTNQANADRNASECLSTITNMSAVFNSVTHTYIWRQQAEICSFVSFAIYFQAFFHRTQLFAVFHHQINTQFRYNNCVITTERDKVSKIDIIMIIYIVLMCRFNRVVSAKTIRENAVVEYGYKATNLPTIPPTTRLTIIWNNGKKFGQETITFED